MSAFKKILDYIKSEPGPHHTRRIAKDLNLNQNTARRIMGELRQIGLAEIVGRSGVERSWRYIEQAQPGKERIVLKPVRVIKEVVKYVQAPYPVRVPAPVKIIEKPIEKVVFLNCGSEGETTMQSLANQQAAAERFIKARNSGYTRKKRG